MAISPEMIRPAVHSDLAALISLLKTLFCLEKDFDFNASLQWQGLKLMVDHAQGCVLVAEVNGRVVGMCSGQLTVSTAEGGPALLVEDVVVHEDFRGEGVGSLLMERLGEWAKTKGVSRLQLLADRNNQPALEFYRKKGWRSTELICLRKRL